MKESTLKSKLLTDPQGENLNPNRQIKSSKHSGLQDQDTEMKKECSCCSQSHRESVNENNVSGFFGQVEQPIQDQESYSSPETPKKHDIDAELVQGHDAVMVEDQESSIPVVRVIDFKSGQKKLSHKNGEDQKIVIMVSSSESKKENIKFSEAERASIHESNGEECLKCVETVHFPVHNEMVDPDFQPECDLEMKKILPSTPKTSSQKKNVNQVNVNEIVKIKSSPLPKIIHSGQKDLQQQAQKFFENRQSPLFPQQEQSKVKMPLAMSPTLQRPHVAQKARSIFDTIEAISNNTEKQLNQMSAQVQSKKNQNSNSKLLLEKQISFAAQCPDLQFSPKPQSKSPFGSHAKFSQRIGISPKAQKEVAESPGKGLQGMPIINRGSQIKNLKDSSFVGFMISPSPNKRNGSPSLVASSSKGRQLFMSPDEGKNGNGANNTPSAAKRYDGSSNTPKNTIMYETKNRSSTITSNFKLARNSVRKTISHSKRDVSDQRELSNIKKLNYGEGNMIGVNSNPQTQEARFTQQIMGGPSPTFFGGKSSNSLQQQLFQKHQNGLNCPPVLYSPAFMTSEARNPYMPIINQNQFVGASFGFRGDMSPEVKKNDGKFSIISSKFTVGRDGQKSDRKSSATFLSSYKKKGRSSKKKKHPNDTTIKLELNPHDIESPDKMNRNSQSGRFGMSSKDKSNSNMKSSGSGSYTSDSQSSSGIQSSSEVSSDKQKFHTFNMENGLFTSAMDASFGGYNQNLINQMAMMNQMHPILQQLNYRYQVIQELQNNMQFHGYQANKGEKCTCGLWKEHQRQYKECRVSCDSDCSSKRKINFYQQPAEIVFNQTNVYNAPHYTSITQGDQSNVNFNPLNTPMMQYQQPHQFGGKGIQMPQSMPNQEAQFFQQDQDEQKRQRKNLQLGKRLSTGQKQDPKISKKQKVENPEADETPERHGEQTSPFSTDKNQQNSKKRSKKEGSSIQKSLSKASKPNNQAPSKCDDDVFDRPSGFPSRPNSKIGQPNQIQLQSDSFQQTPQKEGKTIIVADAQVSFSQVRTAPCLAAGASGNNDTNRNPRTPGSLEKMNVNSFNLNIGDNNQAVSADKIRFHRQNPNQQTFNVFASHFNIDNEQIFGNNNSNTAQYDGNSGLQLQKNPSVSQKVKTKKNDQTKMFQGQSTRKSILEKEQQQKEKEAEIEKMTVQIMASTKTQEQLFEKQREKDPNAACAGCKCKNNQCLKLYCVCLANNATCGPACQCNKLLQKGCCKNNLEHTEDRRKAIVDILGRNINAFKEKMNKDEGNKEEHRTGCNCKKSKCQKNYCECYERGLPCTDKCKCENCHNIGTKCVHNHNQVHSRKKDNGGDEQQQAIQNMAPSPNFLGNTHSQEKRVEINIPDSIDKIDLKLNNSIIKTEEPVLQQFQSRQFQLEEAEPKFQQNQDKIIGQIEAAAPENKQIIQKPISKIKIEQEQEEKQVELSLQTSKQEQNQQINNEEQKVEPSPPSDPIPADPDMKDKKEPPSKEKKTSHKKPIKPSDLPKKEGIVTRSRNKMTKIKKQPQE